jgi:hypothetical protein
VVAVELPVAGGELKPRIKTFWANPLCRGVDFAVAAVALEETTNI